MHVVVYSQHISYPLITPKVAAMKASMVATIYMIGQVIPAFECIHMKPATSDIHVDSADLCLGPTRGGHYIVQSC